MTDIKISLVLTALLTMIFNVQIYAVDNNGVWDSTTNTTVSPSDKNTDNGFQRSDTTAPTTKSKEETARDESVSHACPVTNPNCNSTDKNPSSGGTGGQPIDAASTRSKEQAKENEETTSSCPASNPYCNTSNIKPIATPNDQPGCPVDNPSCNTTSTNKTGTRPSDPATSAIGAAPGTSEIQGPGTSAIQGSGTQAIQR